MFPIRLTSALAGGPHHSFAAERLPTIGMTAPTFSTIGEVPWQPLARALFLETERHELEPLATVSSCYQQMPSYL